jgi:arylsulfatase A
MRPKLLVVFFALLCALPIAAQDAAKPNVVLILADDLGYADLGCFGAQDIRTPHLDQLATQGTRFTDFYVAQPVCTASRAALLSGCYPNRIRIRDGVSWQMASRHGRVAAGNTTWLR